MEFIDELLGMIPRIEKTLIIAKVESPPPALKLRYAEQVIEPEQIYCSNYLLQEYHRTYRFKGIIDREHQDINKFNHTVSSSDMTPNGSGPHKHDIKMIGGSQATMDSTGDYGHHGDLWLTDTLVKGDEVLVAIVGMFYVVVTKITKMPSIAKEGV